jgi:hypothetical protein
MLLLSNNHTALKGGAYGPDRMYPADFMSEAFGEAINHV